MWIGWAPEHEVLPECLCALAQNGTIRAGPVPRGTPSIDANGQLSGIGGVAWDVELDVGGLFRVVERLLFPIDDDGEFAEPRKTEIEGAT